MKALAIAVGTATDPFQTVWQFRVGIANGVSARAARACLAVVVTGLALCACVYIPPIGQKDAGIDPAAFEIGSTSRASARAILKDPKIDDGRFIFDELHSTDGGFLVVFGGGYSGGAVYLPVNTKRARLVLEFDEANLLTRMEVERSNREPPPLTVDADTNRARPARAAGSFVPFAQGWLFPDVKDFTAATFSPSGGMIAASDGSDDIHLIDFEAGKMEEISPEDFDPDGAVHSVAFAPDGRMLAVQSRTIRLIDLEKRRQTLVYDGHGNATFWKLEGALSMAFGPDGLVIASGGWDGLVKVWETATGRELISWAAHEDGVQAIDISSDGRTVATTGGDGFVRLWDARNAKELATLRRHGRPIFSADGQMLAIGTNKYIELWSLVPGPPAQVDVQIAMTALPFVGSVARAPSATDFNPDSDTLLHSYGATALWDWKEGPRVAVIVPKGETFLAFSPDGRRMAGVNRRGVSLWDLPKVSSLED